jgi:glyoxalase family protein
MRQLWRVAPGLLEQAQDDATLIAIRDQERAGIDIVVKQTVLMDGNIPIYHFYYGNADADMGSIATCFPYSRKPGRAGSGQLSCTSSTVPNGAITLLEGALRSPPGRTQWRTGAIRHEVSARAASRGAALRNDRGKRGQPESVDDNRDSTRRRDARLLRCGAVGSRRARAGILLRRGALIPEGRRRRSLPSHRFEVPGTGPGGIVDLHCEPERAPGSWGFGAGTAHHIAFNVETDDALVKQKAIYEELGFTDASDSFSTL